MDTTVLEGQEIMPRGRLRPKHPALGLRGTGGGGGGDCMAGDG